MIIKSSNGPTMISIHYEIKVEFDKLQLMISFQEFHKYGNEIPF